MQPEKDEDRSHFGAGRLYLAGFFLLFNTIRSGPIHLPIEPFSPMINPSPQNQENG
jgi:hypothetical protein